MNGSNKMFQNMKYSIIKFVLFFFILSLAFLSVSTHANAAAPEVCGYVKSESGAPLSNWWVKWTDSGDTNHPAHVRYQLTDTSGRFCFSDWSSLPDDKARSFISETYINPTNPDAGELQPTRNANGFWSGQPDANHPTRKAAIMSSGAGFSDSSAFSCAQVAHNFQAVIPQNGSGTSDTVTLNGGQQDVNGNYYTNSVSRFELPNIIVNTGAGRADCPLPPTRLSPNKETLLSTNQVRLTWDPVVGATSYTVKVFTISEQLSGGTGQDLDARSSLHITQVVTAPEFTLPVAGVSYIWTVSYNKAGCDPRESTATFAIKPPPVVSINNVIDPISNNKVTLSWTVSREVTITRIYNVSIQDLTNPSSSTSREFDGGGEGSFSVVPQLGGNSITYQLSTPVTAGDTYRWRVYTSNSAGQTEAKEATFTVPGGTYNGKLCKGTVTCTAIVNNGPKECGEGQYLYIQREGTGGQCGTSCITCPAGTKVDNSTGCGCMPVAQCGAGCTITNGGPSAPALCTGNTQFYVQQYGGGTCGTACTACPAGQQPAADRCGCVDTPNACVTSCPVGQTLDTTKCVAP